MLFSGHHGTRNMPMIKNNGKSAKICNRNDVNPYPTSLLRERRHIEHNILLDGQPLCYGTKAGVAKPGQRRQVEGLVSQEFLGSNPIPRTFLIVSFHLSVRTFANRNAMAWFIIVVPILSAWVLGNLINK